ncbi:hypothetical protein EU508_10755 [Pseudoalteromonas fuliginea]|uniref:DUF3187 family protein n=1 Tax=Pseudoalteromonas fuliginea TaxID=1872678 RepID=A0AB73BGP5_9GAMM|nr:hypothetical protein [Pseudoalteromonas fuliginea]KAA1160219.1 hypothetical protein EU508_10755 [Pseudoalteromonas fuliginea]
MRLTFIKWVIPIAVQLICMDVMSVELSGESSLQQRFYNHRANTTTEEANKHWHTSFAIEPQLHWLGENSTLSFVPYLRVDNVDSERNLLDVREFMYVHYSDNIEFKIGVGKEFWGVTESQHLIDVINQTDFADAIDQESKLGQPMLNIATHQDYGSFSIWLLPYFRERTFAGVDGRLGLDVPISDEPLYESEQKQKHLDFAARYSHFIDEWEVGLSFFKGTNREPYFIEQGAKLTPYYAQMTQTSVDLQAIFDDLLVKLEMRYRDSLENQLAYISGVELTQTGVANTQWNLGWIAEYSYNDTAQALYQNDLFLGWRLALNDFNGTEMLFGISQDLDNSDEYSIKLETSSRINVHWKWQIEAWLFETNKSDSPLYSLKQDDFLEINIFYHF